MSWVVLSAASSVTVRPATPVVDRFPICVAVNAANCAEVSAATWFEVKPATPVVDSALICVVDKDAS